MGKRRIIIFVILVVTGVLIWQLPAIIQTIPSRFVAAYLPKPMQSLVERQHVEVLPTASSSIDTDTLLQPAPRTDGNGANGLIGQPTRLPPPVVSISGSASDKETSQQPAVTANPMPFPTATVTPIPIPAAARLAPIRHQFQTWNNCGPATLAMALSYFDVLLNQENTAAILKPNPEDRNVSPWEMAAFVNDETNLAAIDRTNGNLDTIRRLIAGGFPVIVELGLDPPGEYRWLGWYGHYLLMVAYDDATEHFWVYDSWFGTSEIPAENADDQGRQVGYQEFDDYWRQFNRNYIAFYKPEQEEQVAQIIGQDMDDQSMWLRALNSTQVETASEFEVPYLWFNLGTIYNALGAYDKAASAFDQARALGLPWRMLWYQFGPYEAYFQVGRYEEVILLADVTLKERPYFEESYYYKGLALQALGELGQARDNLEKSSRFNPNFAAARDALAQLTP